MNLETVIRETKIVAIYLVSQRLGDDLPWWRRPGGYGRIKLQNVIEVYDQNKQKLKDMTK